MGYEYAGGETEVESNLLYHSSIMSSVGADTIAVGIDPDGKTINIYKIIISANVAIQYYLQDSAANIMYPADVTYNGGLFLDLGNTPIPVPTENSDLFIRNITAAPSAIVVYVWYTLET